MEAIGVNEEIIIKKGRHTFLYKHTVITRIMHIIHLVSMVMLMLTGFQVYAPGFFRLFPTLEIARYIHFIFMYLIGWTFVFKFYYTIVTGEIKELLFTWRDFRDIPILAKHYLYDIFVGIPSPKHWGKYNPGQKMVYTLWPALLLAQGITGIAMYFIPRFTQFNDFFGGLANIKAWHFVICWLFVLTTLLHFYLGSTGPKIIDFYKSVITGYEKRGKH